MRAGLVHQFPLPRNAARVEEEASFGTCFIGHVGAYVPAFTPLPLIRALDRKRPRIARRRARPCFDSADRLWVASEQAGCGLRTCLQILLRQGGPAVATKGTHLRTCGPQGADENSKYGQTSGKD